MLKLTWCLKHVFEIRQSFWEETKSLLLPGAMLRFTTAICRKCPTFNPCFSGFCFLFGVMGGYLPCSENAVIFMSI